MKKNIKSYDKIKHIIVFSAIIPLIILISLIISNSLQNSTIKRVNYLLEKMENSWAQVEVDGLQVTISGKALNERQRLKTIEVLETALLPSLITDRTSAQIPEYITKENLRLIIIKDNNNISLIGLVPNKNYRESIVSKISKYPNVNISVGISNDENTKVSSAWLSDLELVADSLSLFSQGRISINSEKINITILSSNNDETKKVKQDLSQKTQFKPNFLVDIVTPKTLISPYSFEYFIDENIGAISTCSVETLSDQKTVIALAKKFPLARIPNCEIGIGTPSLNWINTVQAAMSLLQEIGEGSIKFSDLEIKLLLKKKDPKIEILKLIEKFEQTLPKEFKFYSTLNKSVSKKEAETKQPLEIKIAKSSLNKINITGHLNTELEKQIIKSYAKAIFAESTINLNINLTKSTSINFVRISTIAMEALKELYSGTLIVQKNKIKLIGRVSSEMSANKAQEHLKNMLAENSLIETDITFDKSLSPVILVMTPEDCVKKINEILKKEKIVFEPASTAIKGSSRLAIKKIATVVKKCEDVRMEIGGHTDSQGRKAMNLNLSQLRADAVKAALLSRKVLVKKLVPVGYGETLPIADNQTEEGREINRRIEFKLLKKIDSEKTLGNSKELISYD
ncbi:MAG: OmpA family protein [Paracoccaceae bacterium]